MAGNPCVQCRVSAETKARLSALAHQRGLTESAFLQRLIELALVQSAGVTANELARVEPVPRDARLSVRLRREDFLLLRERAGARAMPAATYASMVLRAHLRAVAPLPDRELAELKASLAALGIIGRNLNQLARVANTSGSIGAQVGTELRALLRAIGALREHVRGLVKANLISWEVGHADEADR